MVKGNRSWGIVPAAMPRVAPADPQQSTNRPPQCPVLANRLDEVAATGGIVAAVLPQKGAERQLVQPHQGNQGPAGEAPNLVNYAADHSQRLRTASFRAACSANRTRDSVTPARSGEESGRGTTTRSTPLGSRARLSRNASRSSRFHRFLTTAFPILRDTDSPNRGKSSPFSCAKTRSWESEAVRRSRKARRKSAFRRSRYLGPNRRSVMPLPPQIRARVLGVALVNLGKHLPRGSVQVFRQHDLNLRDQVPG